MGRLLADGSRGVGCSLYGLVNCVLRQAGCGVVEQVGVDVMVWCSVPKYCDREPMGSVIWYDLLVCMLVAGKGVGVRNGVLGGALCSGITFGTVVWATGWSVCCFGLIGS